MQTFWEKIDRLTNSQHKIYFFIREYHQRYGQSPSMAEMAEACGLSGSSVVRNNLFVLKRMGLISFQRNRARSVLLLQTE